MKLKKLDITGFKSFLDRASIQFPPGISAVVGPNGCGKSNIVDALRWVMGEQSVKQLRGKSMEDVIFAGADGKKPLGMAEVSLTLQNDNGSAPEELKDCAEIMITRRLYRSGESAYLLNKQPCRLKDIHNVFLGSGMGAKSFAIIQQGNIGAITDAGPEERRFFIEEAAGITRYKNRKNEALRKVASTKQNLLRLNDIISEVHRQMKGLKRQARKAELFNAYQKRIRELDALLALHHYDELSDRIQERVIAMDGIQQADVALVTQMAAMDAAIEALKLDLSQQEQALSSQKSQKFDFQRKLDKAENDLVHQRKEKERLGKEIIELNSVGAELETNNAKIQSEVAQVEEDNKAIAAELENIANKIVLEQQSSTGLRDRLDRSKQANEEKKTALMKMVSQEARVNNIYQVAAGNKENIQRRLKRIGEEEVLAVRNVTEHEIAEKALSEDLEQRRHDLLDLDSTIKQLRERADETNMALGRQINQVQSLTFERNRINSNYQTLKQMDDNFEWYQDGVRAILQRASISQTPELSADVENNATGEAGPRFLDTISGVLADKLNPEPGYETAVEAVLAESLQYIVVDDQESGLAAVDYLQNNQAGRSGFIPLSSVKAVQTDDHQKVRPEDLLLNHISVAPGFEKIAHIFLTNVLVSNDLHEAVQKWNQNGFSKTVVSKQGDLVSPEGNIVGGSKDNKVNILAKKQELKVLQVQLADLDREVENAVIGQADLEARLKTLEVELQQRLTDKEALTQEKLESEKELYKAGEDLKNARRRLEIIRLEQEQLEGEESDIDDEMALHHQSLDQIRTDISVLQDQIARGTREIEAIAAEMEAFNQKIIELKLKQTSCNATYENSASTYKRLTAFLADGKKRFAQIAGDIKLKTERRDAAAAKIIQNETVLDEMISSLKQLSEAVESGEAQYNDVLVQLKEKEKALSLLKGNKEEIMQKCRALELEKSQLEMQRQNIADQLTDRYHKTLEEFRTEYLKALEKFERDLSDNAAAIKVLENERAKLKSRISKIGDVNLGAIKEFEEHNVRHDFLTRQRDDLLSALDDLQKVIKKINRITQEKFMATFDAINVQLKEVFPRLFEGGTATLVLTQPDNPLDTGVEFMIHPPGKKLTRLSLLSGGEKALSAIAFIFSIFFLKPASFCLMDEIDAPLDDANVFRFNNLLKIIGEKSQILMITHNKHTMEFADMLFGVTMEKKGISKLVSVNLERPN